VPVSRMLALKVTRSTIAATSRGSGKTVPHSLKGRFVAIAMEALRHESASVMIPARPTTASAVRAVARPWLRP
jgi:hypothetical protein